MINHEKLESLKVELRKTVEFESNADKNGISTGRMKSESKYAKMLLAAIEVLEFTSRANDMRARQASDNALQTMLDQWENV